MEQILAGAGPLGGGDEGARAPVGALRGRLPGRPRGNRKAALQERVAALVSTVGALEEALAEERRRLEESEDDRRRAKARLMALLKDARAESAAARKEAADLKERLKEAEAAAPGVAGEGRGPDEERARSEALEAVVGRLEGEVSGREAEIRRLKARLAALEASRAREQEAARGETSMVVSEMASVPRTLDDVLTLAERAWPERLLVLESAHDAARAWSGRDLDRPWRALCAVAECLWPLHFVEASADPVREFASRTGFRFTPTESFTVSTMPRLREARTFPWEGRRTYMPAHVAVTGGSGDSNIRMHLCFDEEGRRIVVGHLGRHLDNTLT